MSENTSKVYFTDFRCKVDEGPAHKLSRLIEQHSRHDFLMSPYCKCPCCRYDHEQVLIQELFF